MARKPDTPCATCGKLLWSGPRSQPEGDRVCRECRKTPLQAPADASLAPWVPGAGLGPRGRAVWREMDGAKLPPPERVLLEEACRIADRLDKLDGFLLGREDAWLKFWRKDDGTTIRVVVDRSLSEARQQAETLRSIIVELVKKQAAEPSEKPEATRRDELAKRREDRRRAAGL